MLVSIIFKITTFVQNICLAGKHLSPVHFVILLYVFLRITVIISVNGIKWLVFVIEMQCVCCEVGTKFLLRR